MTVRGGVNVDAMLETYLMSGDRRVLDAALATTQRADYREARSQWAQGQLEPGHDVIYYEHIRVPALLYPWTGERDDLAATEKAIEWGEQRYLLPMGLTSGEEYHAGIGATRNVETCNVAASMWTFLWMLRITGEGEYSDRIERVFFNAGPAPVDREFKTMCYYQSPNRYSTSLPLEAPPSPARIVLVHRSRVPLGALLRRESESCHSQLRHAYVDGHVGWRLGCHPIWPLGRARHRGRERRGRGGSPDRVSVRRGHYLGGESGKGSGVSALSAHSWLVPHSGDRSEWREGWPGRREWWVHQGSPPVEGERPSGAAFSHVREGGAGAGNAVPANPVLSQDPMAAGSGERRGSTAPMLAFITGRCCSRFPSRMRAPMKRRRVRAINMLWT